MIKYLVILAAGLGIGYTYGYMHGAAGDEDVIGAGLNRVGAHRMAARIGAPVDAVRQEERLRQAAIDSIKQARIDSISSAIHH